MSLTEKTAVFHENQPAVCKKGHCFGQVNKLQRIDMRPFADGKIHRIIRGDKCSRVKTAVKKVNAAIEAKDKDAAASALKNATSELSRAHKYSIWSTRL